MRGKSESEGEGDSEGESEGGSRSGWESESESEALLGADGRHVQVSQLLLKHLARVERQDVTSP